MYLLCAIAAEVLPLFALSSLSAEVSSSHMDNGSRCFVRQQCQLRGIPKLGVEFDNLMKGIQLSRRLFSVIL